MRLVAAALGLQLFLAAPVPHQAASTAPSTPQDEDHAILALESLDGDRQDIGQFEGRIVLVNFWATWCVPCREEMPILVRLQDRYRDRGVQVIAVSTDEPAARDKVAAFAAEHGLNFPVWVGATTRDMERLDLGQALPATAILDGEGRIVARILGPVTRKDLRRRIEWLLDAPPPLVDNFGEAVQPAEHEGHEHADPHGHHDDDEHEHGSVGMEGASLVPS